jgi:hypothetical protein
MKSATIHSLLVRLSSDEKTVEVVAQVLEGNVEQGMELRIELNRSLSVSIPILRVTTLPDDQVELLLACDEKSEAQFVLGLNFADETLMCEEAK